MAGLTQAQLDQLSEKGYVVVENVLDPEEDLAPVMAEYGEVLDGIAHDLYAEGVILVDVRRPAVRPAPYSGLRRKRPNLRPTVSTSRCPRKSEGADAPMHTGPAVFNLLT